MPHRFRMNPAVSPGAFVTAVTFVVGYALFLGIAMAWVGLGWGEVWRMVLRPVSTFIVPAFLARP